MPRELNLHSKRDYSSAVMFLRRIESDRRLLPLLTALALLGCGDLKDPTSPPAAASSHTITVSSFQFTPDRLEIRAGDRVTWRNAEGFHNVQADDGSFRCAEGCDREGGVGDPSAGTWSFSRVFADAGAVRYFCEVHGGPGGAGMAGMVVVRP